MPNYIFDCFKDMRIRKINTLKSVIIMVSLFAFCISYRNITCCSQDIDQRNLYHNPEYKFKIVFPNKWKVTRGDGTNYIVNAEGPDSSGININIENTDPKYTADMLSVKDAGYIAYGLKNIFPDISLVSSSETQISNRKALMIKCNHTTSEANMIMTQYITIEEGKIFTITSSAPSDRYDQYEEIFTNSISSFMLGDFLVDIVEPKSEEDELLKQFTELIEKSPEDENPEFEYEEDELFEQYVELIEKSPEDVNEEAEDELSEQYKALIEKSLEEEHQEFKSEEDELIEQYKALAEESLEDKQQEVYEDEHGEQHAELTKESPEDEFLEYEKKILTAPELKDSTDFSETIEEHIDLPETVDERESEDYADKLPLQQPEEAKHTIEPEVTEKLTEQLSDSTKYDIHSKMDDYPLPEKYVEDRADIIDEQTENRLNIYLEILEYKTETRMLVLTTDTIGEIPIRQFSNGLIEKWDLGQTGKNKGVLIIVAVNDKKYSIKIDPDLKTRLTSSFCTDIGKNLFVPNFSEGNYNQGIYQGTVSIIDKIAHEKISKICAKGDVVMLSDPDDGTVGMYEDSSLGEISFLFTNGVEATIMDVKTPDGSPVLYKVQVWENVGWVTENDISD